MTRDVRGTFTALGSYFTKYQELMKLLERKFATKLLTNSNSWSTCFQYWEPPNEKSPYRRFKVYCKTLQQIQSVAPQKALGINTNALFNP